MVKLNLYLLKSRFFVCLLSMLVVLQISPCLAKTPLEKMFDGLGDKTNLSTPGAFQDQAAGYYTGGGFVMRSNSQAFQPIQISLPNITAGCRGVDAYFGGMSFIKSQQLLQLGKNMLSNVPTYFFQLALKTMAPQIETELAQLRKIVLDVNSQLLDDCRMTQQMFAASMPSGSAFEEHACTDVKNQRDSEDWFGAKEKCKRSADVKQGVLEAKRASPDLLVGEYNLSWHAISKMEQFDPDIKQFILTVVGTVISREEGDKFRIHYIEGRADDQQFLAAYLKGGTTQRLVCDSEDKCLNPRLEGLPRPNRRNF